jgi:hypothetical protein
MYVSFISYAPCSFVSLFIYLFNSFLTVFLHFLFLFYCFPPSLFMFLENLLFCQLNAFQTVPSLFPSPFLITSRLQAIFVKLFKIKFDVAKEPVWVLKGVCSYLATLQNLPSCKFGANRTFQHQTLTPWSVDWPRDAHAEVVVALSRRTGTSFTSL